MSEWQYWNEEPCDNKRSSNISNDENQEYTPPGRKFRPTAHVGCHADSEGSRGVAECRKVAFSLRLLAEKLIPVLKI